MKIIDLLQIKDSINIAEDLAELVNSQKTAFMDFSAGLYDVPPPMQFFFPQFGSDCHLKGGYKKGHKNLIIKIANGSPVGNNGVIFVFAADTGALKAILSDQGFLTTLRTAIAGLIISKCIAWAPKNIGIMGSGNLAVMLYELLRLKYPGVNIMLYARDKAKAASISQAVCDCPEALVAKCDVIFTATSSTYPIIHDLKAGPHKVIIALGSDDEHKSELSSDIFLSSDVVVVDEGAQEVRRPLASPRAGCFSAL